MVVAAGVVAYEPSLVGNGGGGGGGGSDTANLFLVVGGGACTRSASLVNYAASASPDARCGDMQTAYDASTTGDMILAMDDGGAFSTQTIVRNSETQSGPVRTFKEAPGENWVINGGLALGTDNGSESGNPPNYVTYDGMTLNGSFFCVWAGGAASTDVTIQNATISDTSSASDLISCGDSANFTVKNTILGPSCCTGVGIGMGKSNTTSPGNTNHLYQDLTIFGLWDSCVGAGGADAWPTEYGSCSGTGYGDWAGGGGGSEPRHIDGIQLVDCDN
jgi:hypothetical protein